MLRHEKKIQSCHPECYSWHTCSINTCTDDDQILKFKPGLGFCGRIQSKCDCTHPQLKWQNRLLCQLLRFASIGRLSSKDGPVRRGRLSIIKILVLCSTLMSAPIFVFLQLFAMYYNSQYLTLKIILVLVVIMYQSWIHVYVFSHFCSLHLLTKASTAMLFKKT